MAASAALQPAGGEVKDLYEMGEIPPLGHVPAKMYAWAIRRERHGPPEQSHQLEVLPVWSIGDDEVLVYVMAAGVNYNGVWAGLGAPISPFDCTRPSTISPVPTRRASSGRWVPR